MGMGNCAGEDVFYVCNTYKKKSKERCKNHYIRYDVLSEYILSDIKAVLESYRSDKTAFREFLFEKLGKDNEVQSYEKDIEELKARNEKASQKMKMLYEDRLDGLITREQYIEQYELFKKEQQYCSQRLAEIERSMTGHKDENDVINSFIDVLEQHDQVDFLDSELLNRFISRIDVHQKEEQPDGTYHQEIDIKYRFIGGFES
jgi:DNA primase large subunit